eukprot:TRINITY_DN3310_c0_g1_i5.p1 TRINITY_DN3310_c0_g1~~TRINITY_DN3310_c0_g1_i5.p1  ORF type:complete len:603 (+),score=110.53 TRINITY_DN3310_c0_g1_i5:89-1897(+)
MWEAEVQRELGGGGDPGPDRVDHTRNLYRVDEVLSAMQKAVRRSEEADAQYWACELYASGLCRAAVQRLVFIGTEDLALPFAQLPQWLLELFDEWEEAFRQEQQSPAARRCLLRLVRGLARMRKGRTVCLGHSIGRMLLLRRLQQLGLSLPQPGRPLSGGGVQWSVWHGLSGADCSEGRCSLLHSHSGDRLAALPVPVRGCTDCRAALAGQLGAAASRAADEGCSEAEEEALYCLTLLEEAGWEEAAWSALLAVPGGSAAEQAQVDALRALSLRIATAERLRVFHALLLRTRRRWLDYQQQHAEGEQPDEADIARAFRLARHPHGVPWYCVDQHTLRGKGHARGKQLRGRDTSGDLMRASRELRVGAATEWDAEERSRSHGPGRVWPRSLREGYPSMALQFFDQGALVRDEHFVGPERPPVLIDTLHAPAVASDDPVAAHPAPEDSSVDPWHHAARRWYANWELAVGHGRGSVEVRQLLEQAWERGLSRHCHAVGHARPRKQRLQQQPQKSTRGSPPTPPPSLRDTRDDAPPAGMPQPQDAAGALRSEASSQGERGEAGSSEAVHRGGRPVLALGREPLLTIAATLGGAPRRAAPRAHRARR